MALANSKNYNTMHKYEHEHAFLVDFKGNVNEKISLCPTGL